MAASDDASSLSDDLEGEEDANEATNAGSSEDEEPITKLASSSSQPRTRACRTKFMDSSAYTGGIEGKAASTKLPANCVENKVGKFKVSVPVVEMIPHKPQLRRYLTSHCIEVATQAGEPITVQEDTKIRAVTRE